MEDDNKERRALQYYVAKQDTVLVRLFGTCDVNVNDLRLGMLVEALEDSKDSVLRIRVTDIGGSKSWYGTEWRCHKYDLIQVSQKIWHYLLAVQSPQERVRLANDKILCERLRNISVNDKVWYCPDSSNKRTRELAVVRYIGLVPQLGLGHYIGLELLVLKKKNLILLLLIETFVQDQHKKGVCHLKINYYIQFS